MDRCRFHSPAARPVGGLLGLLLAGVLDACTSSSPEGPRSTELGDRSKLRADRPTFDVGQTWNRRDGVYRLTRIERDLYVFESGDREVHLSRDLTVAAMRKGKFFGEFDPAPKLSWPLEVGKRGVTGGVWRSDTNIAGVPSQFFWEVAAYEEVDTVAGTFKAFRVDFTFNMRPGPSGAQYSRRLHMWYAPEVKQVVKFTDDHASRWYSFLRGAMTILSPSPSKAWAIALPIPLAAR